MKIKLLYIICLLTIKVTTPRAGDLDPTFGSGTGKVTTDINNTSNIARAALLQPDGKIIAVGYVTTDDLDFDFALARYNPNGSIDTSFGGGSIGPKPGIVTTHIADGDDQAYAALLQPDGKIIAIGYSSNGGNLEFALARYNADGSFDSSFGGNGTLTPGTVTTSIAGSFDTAQAALLQPDGKIIAIGNAFVGGISDFALARYNPDGSLDSSFGGNGTHTPGTVTTPISIGEDQARAALLQPDGKIIAIGSSSVGGIFDFALARYSPDGSLDSSFGTDGIVLTSISNDQDFAYAALLQPDGKIIAVGSTSNSEFSGNDFALVRYNPDGSRDSSFGADGIVITDLSGDNDQANAALLQPDGKIIALGYTNNGTDPDEFALVRYNPDGSRDSSFGTDGKVITDFSGGTDQVNAALLQPDGKIIAVGQANTGTENGDDFALARYLNDALTITKTASAPIVCPGQNITYTICANNLGGGGGTVNGIEITDILPDNIIFRSAAANIGTFDPITGTWSIDYLQVNNKATLKIKARVDQCAGNMLIKNTALTSYSYVDMVSDSSIIDVTNQDFSTTECISTLPVVYENLNIIAQRTDCGVDNIADHIDIVTNKINTLNEQQVEDIAAIDIIINKLNCLATYLSATDCTF